MCEKYITFQIQIMHMIIMYYVHLNVPSAVILDILIIMIMIYWQIYSFIEGIHSLSFCSVLDFISHIFFLHMCEIEKLIFLTASNLHEI